MVDKLKTYKEDNPKAFWGVIAGVAVAVIGIGVYLFKHSQKGNLKGRRL